MQKLVSIEKFKYNDTIYACIANCYTNCLRLANKVTNCNNREYIGSYLQGDTNCEIYYKFLEDVDVIIRQGN